MRMGKSPVLETETFPPYLRRGGQVCLPCLPFETFPPFGKVGWVCLQVSFRHLRKRLFVA